MVILKYLIKILLLLIENTNHPDGEGETPIHVAACKGHTEIVRILVPLTSYPNSPNTRFGDTPIHQTARIGEDKQKLSKSWPF